MRMNMKKLLLAFLVTTSTCFAEDSFLKSVKKMKWGDLDVVWIEDNKFPRFSASVYFFCSDCNL